MSRFLVAAALGSALSIALPSAPASGAGPSASLERLVSFEAGGVPDMAGPGRLLVSEMWTADAVELPGGKQLRVARTQDAGSGWVSNRIALSGAWHGLAMTALSADGIPDSGTGLYRLDFADSASAVTRRVAGLGLTLGRTEDEEGCVTDTRVVARPGGSSLVVSFNC